MHESLLGFGKGDWGFQARVSIKDEWEDQFIFALTGGTSGMQRAKGSPTEVCVKGEVWVGGGEGYWGCKEGYSLDSGLGEE